LWHATAAAAAAEEISDKCMFHADSCRIFDLAHRLIFILKLETTFVYVFVFEYGRRILVIVFN